MDKRFEEIDSFLKKMAEVYKENPEEFNVDTIYEALMFFNLNDIETQEWFSEMGFFEYFQQWVLKAGDNIEGLTSPIDSYFWVFRNTKIVNYEAEHSGKIPVKLYIPIGKSTFMYVLPNLFEFLNDNDIMHTSKICGGLRTDDLVVRVYDSYEAKQIIKFVNENFQNLILETNPFILRDGLVGITADGYQSYNNDVSIYIAEFIKQTYGRNISLETFRQFVEKNINYFSRDDKTIMDILLLSLNPKTTTDDFFEYWNLITDSFVKSEVRELDDDESR